MQWIESIGREGSVLRPIYVDKDGKRAFGSLTECKSRMVVRGYQAAILLDVPLESLQPADPAEYLAAMGLENVDPRGHEIFVFDHDNKLIHIPAAVLLQSLISRLSNVGDSLLEAGSLTRIARPLVTDGALSIKYDRKVTLNISGQLPCVQSRFTWLSCFPSARRMWGSVYANATQGRLSLSMPSATIRASVIGLRADGAVYGTRLSIKELTPTEEALPFARPFASSQFTFRSHPDTPGLQKFQASGQHSSITSDDRIPRGEHGWAMTDAEWHSVFRGLSARGYLTRGHARAGLDIALQKFGSGVTWKTFGAACRNSQSTHFRWNQSGKWDVFIEELTAIRRDTATLLT